MYCKELGLKRCYACRVWHTLDRYYKSKKKADGVRGICKACEQIPKRERDWRRRGIEITREEYTVLLNKQGNRCAICEEKPNEGFSLSVDHCHNSGQVRGLLCGQCNLGIGSLGDSIDRLSSAIKYLEDHNLETPNPS